MTRAQWARIEPLSVDSAIVRAHTIHEHLRSHSIPAVSPLT
ncbi:hypothetical protein ACFWP5_08430 [Streptomyces sp. NPDC058469]